MSQPSAIKAQGTIDLEYERSKATFPVGELTELLYGGKAEVERLERIKKLVENDPMLNFDCKMERYYGSRIDMFKRTCKIIDRLYTLRKQHNLSDSDFDTLYNIVAEDTPLHLQEWVFIPCLRALASEEQVQQFVSKAQNYQIIGCYAQTELSHGSNVMGLKTTATYIKETDEFEFNTPTPDACKWWVGQLGKLATHAVVFAQLYIDDVCYGPHPFLIPIRSLDTYLPLPGITIKDIGPKMGFNAVDNGTISFNKYRAPRTCMLMRYAKVTKDGQYVPPPNPKLLYGSMLAVRVGIVSGAYRVLAAASTIAVRYSCVRRQFGHDSRTGLEQPVLDYKAQQYRVLSMLATVFALHFTGQWMRSAFNQLNTEFAQGKFDFLPAIHAASSGLKGTVTNITATGIEQLRLSLGGHGYSAYSGMPAFYTTYTHMQTAEGENYVLAQQTARHLIKCTRTLASGGSLHPQDPANYLAPYVQSPRTDRKCQVSSRKDWRDTQVQIDAYRHRAANGVMTVAAAMQKELSNGLTPEQLALEFQVEFARISHAHCMYIIMKSFADGVERIKKEHPRLYSICKLLQDVFALYFIDKEFGDFAEDGYINGKQVQLLRAELRALLGELRQNAVPLVDAFAISDVTLASALGRYDGDVYNTLLKLIDKEPLNSKEVADGIREYIFPHLHAKL